MNYPPLPRVIQGLAGPITIDRPAQVGHELHGQWLPIERRILVAATFTREYAWLVLLHELVHSHLTDVGIKMSRAREEIVCDTIASGMAHLLRALLAAQPTASTASGASACRSRTRSR